MGAIEFLSGPLKGNIYTLTKPVTTLGREPANDIVIADNAISRHHAHIMYVNGMWSITKLAPQNSVTINKNDVQQAPLHKGDIVVLGTVCTFRFLPGAEQEAVPPPLNPVNATRVVRETQQVAPPPPPPFAQPVQGRQNVAPPQAMPPQGSILIGPFGTEPAPGPLERIERQWGHLAAL